MSYDIFVNSVKSHYLMNRFISNIFFQARKLKNNFAKIVKMSLLCSFTSSVLVLQNLIWANNFIPSSLYESLKHNLILRSQHHQEHLSLYVSEVKLNSLTLHCSYSEEQLVQFIH